MRFKGSWQKIYGNWYLGVYLHQLMRTLTFQLMLGHRMLDIFISKEVEMKKEAAQAQPLGKVTLTVGRECYEAVIMPITARAGDPRSPWYKEDVLLVWLDFDRAEGKHPGATLGFGLQLPVKQYKPDELLRLIRTEGEKRLEEIILKSDQEHAYQQAKDRRQKELDELASQLNESLEARVYNSVKHSKIE